MLSRIVIIGSRGMLGHALMRSFSSFDPIGLDFSQLDITKRDAVFSVLSELYPSIVLNAAGYTAVDEAEEKREIAFAVNGQAVSFLAAFCAEKNIPLVHFSTDYVFDGRSRAQSGSSMEKIGYTEEDSPHPLNVYGESKALGEKFLLESGAPFYLIRTSWLFGPNGKNFVQTMLELAEQKKEIRVVNDQIGKPTSTFDLADATKKLLAEKMPFGIYHIVNEDAVSWFSFAKEIFAIRSLKNQFSDDGLVPKILPQTTAELGRKALRPAHSILLNTKFPLLRSHNEALQEYLSK